MARYKDRASAKAIEKDFPHFVDVAVPPGGLGNTLNAMYNSIPGMAFRPSAVMRGVTLMAMLFDGASLIRL